MLYTVTIPLPGINWIFFAAWLVSLALCSKAIAKYMVALWKTSPAP